MAGSTETCFLVHCLSWITLLTLYGVLSKGWSVVNISTICCNSCVIVTRLNVIVCLKALQFAKYHLSVHVK